MFKPELYEKTHATDLMFYPEVTVNMDDTMETVAGKIQSSGKFNIAVLDEEGKYLGFVSRANVFSKYRSMLKEFSAD